MGFWIIIIGIIAGMILVISYTVYGVCFSNKENYMKAAGNLPRGRQFDPYKPLMEQGLAIVDKEAYEEVKITSHDHLTLTGSYYEFGYNAPVIIFFHGYRARARRDGNGLFLYAKTYGYNILLVNQRGHAPSGGRNITFGIKERKDVLDWSRYVVERFGEKVRILLAGISMGASSVLMASELDLPKQVKGIIADCPFSSAKEIILRVIHKMGFPGTVAYPLVRLGARIFGGFRLEEASAVTAVKNSHVPILLIHGEADNFVPCTMSRACYEASPKNITLYTIPEAGHGMSFCVDSQTYENALVNFALGVLDERR